MNEKSGEYISPQDMLKQVNAFFDYIDRRDAFHGTKINSSKQQKFHQLCVLAKIYEARHRDGYEDHVQLRVSPPNTTSPDGAVILFRELRFGVDLSFSGSNDMELLKKMIAVSDEMIPAAELIDEKTGMQQVSLMLVVDGIVEK